MSKNTTDDYSSILDLTNIQQGNIKYNYLLETIAFDEFFIEYFNLDKEIKPNIFININDKLLKRSSLLKDVIKFITKKKINNKYTKITINTKQEKLQLYLKKIGLFREEYIVNYFVAPEIDDFIKEYHTLSEVLEFSGEISKTNFWWYDLSNDKIQHLKNSSFYRSVGISTNDDDEIFSEYVKMMDAAAELNLGFARYVEEEHQCYDDCVSGVRNSYNCKYPLLTKKNSIVWIDSFAKIVRRDKYNRPLLMIGVDLLISEEVTAQMEAETLKKVIDEGLNNSDIGVWWIKFNKDHKTFEFNDKLKELYGFKNLSEHNSNIIEPQDYYWQHAVERVLEHFPEYNSFFEEDAKKFKKLMSGKINQYRSIFPLFNTNDTINWLEVRSSAVSKSSDGKPNIISGTAIDITELYESGRVKGISDRFIKLQNANKAAVEMADLLIWTIDFDEHPSGDYFYGSESYNDKLGLTKDKKGYISSMDYYSTIIDDEDNNDILSLGEVQNLLESCHHDNADGFDGVIIKHRNIKTNEILYMKHYAKVHNRKIDGTLRHIGGYIVDVTNEYKQKARVEKLKISHSKIQEINQLAIAAGNLLVFNINYNQKFEDSDVYVNELFVKKLGIKACNDSSIKYKEYKATTTDDEEGKELYAKSNKAYFDILKGSSNSITEIITKHKNHMTGEVIYLEHYAQVEERDSYGKVLTLGGFLRDVTNELLYERKIKYLAEKDVLTDLFNRNIFEQHCKEIGDNLYTIIISDIDGLKLANDIYGHFVGDKILSTYASYLKKIYRKGNIYRIGGDEFAVITSVVDEESIEDMNRNLQECIDEYNMNHHCNIGVSIGYDIVNKRKSDFQNAFITAENEMYHRKLSNRSSRKSKTLETLLSALNEKTEETKEHCDRLAVLSQEVLKKMGYSRTSELHDISLAATVHDIGKITISEDILTKPGRLTDLEYEKIKKHSEAGYKIIINIISSNNIAESILYHHERHDGCGYPYGLKGDEIPLYAKIISVCDAYDTMINGRTYKKPISIEDALDEIERCKGTQFDPKIADILIEVVREKNIEISNKELINA
ncbi:diguanylate cyclase [Mycoplasmatota bacterium WC44]